MTLAFTVYGTAASKGSMKARLIRTKTGKMFPIVTDSNRGVASWQQLIKEGANHAIAALPASDRAVNDGPVRVTVAFYLPRPQNLMKRGLPVAHLKTPDLDKVTRAVFDALAKVAYVDDKLIVEAVIGKFYADVDDVAHVDIRVEPTAGVKPIVVAPAPLPLFEAVQ